MLFYAQHKILNLIPESYIKISISNLINMSNINNGMDLKALLPENISDRGNKLIKRINVEFDKDEYKKYLTSPVAMKYIMLICSSLDTGLNVVLINHNKENIKYLKRICKFIKKEYGYPYYKFTSLDDVTLKMRKKSIFDDESRLQIQEDIKKYMR